MDSFSKNELSLINQTIIFVKAKLANAEKGHDWLHIERVYQNALKISKYEECNPLVVALASLLHDIADEKFKLLEEANSAEQVSNFLNKIGCANQIIKQVVFIVENVSFKSSFDNKSIKITKELAIVRDADRLDALGAIGIARTFHYGGYKNREMYNTSVDPQQFNSKSEYLKSESPTLNHFYEKLLHLKKLMLTKTGQQLAEKRHQFMLEYLEHFYEECNIPKK